MPLPRKIQGLRAFLPDKDAHVLVLEACLTQGLQGWIELVVGVEKARDRIHRAKDVAFRLGQILLACASLPHGARAHATVPVHPVVVEPS